MSDNSKRMEAPEILACREKVLRLPVGNPRLVDYFFSEEFAIRDIAAAPYLPKNGIAPLGKIGQRRI